MKLWICEKPDQGTAVAARIGIVKRGNGYIETKDGNVTWCFGHMLELKQPGEYRETWKKWDLSSLPIIPDDFHLKVSADKIKQTNVIKQLLKESNHVVIATDGDREGELLGREILEHFNWVGKVERMWNSALDDKTIDNALASITPGTDSENLYQAGKARSEIDYIFGMTFSRAATLCFASEDETFSVGRVQTALLDIIVKRDLEIENFKSVDYYDLKATLLKDGNSYTLTCTPKAENRITDIEKAKELEKSLCDQSGELVIEQKRKKKSPPKLFDVSSLQQLANKRFGWSADKTLDVGQLIYDKKFISYPRSVTEQIPINQKEDQAGILDNLRGLAELKNSTDLISGELTIRDSTFYTGEKVHHGIIPTLKKINLSELSKDEVDLYLLIAERYLLIFLDDYEYDSTSIKLEINNNLFSGTGNIIINNGWKAVNKDDDDDDKEESNLKFPELVNGEKATISSIEILPKATKPKPKYTQTSVLPDMKNVTNLTDDPELLKTIKARIKSEVNPGFGTAATRHTFIPLLVKRKYIEINKNILTSTDIGRKLINALPNKSHDPIETSVMENKLDQISEGNLSKDEFMQDAIKTTNEILEAIIEASKTFVKSAPKHPCPECSKPLRQRKGKNGKFWACSGYPGCNFSTSDNKGKPAIKEKAIFAGTCPDCSLPLVKREGFKKGSKKEKYCFWGCSGFPKCKKSVPDKDGKPDLPEKSEAI